MRNISGNSIKLFLRVATLIVSLSFVLDPAVSVTSSELKANPAAPLQEDLTGTWTSDSMGKYYVRQVGNTVWWMGQSKDGGVSYTNVFRGVRNGETIMGGWADVPAGKYLGNGSITLSISRVGDTMELRRVNETGGFGESLWRKTSNMPTPASTNETLPDNNTIPGGVLNGKATSLPKPTYPPIARRARVSGNVFVEVTVDENGNVISARAVSGHALLQAAAVTAARNAKFSPTRVSGQLVKVTGVITYNFPAE